jgi:hypothetical protein
MTAAAQCMNVNVTVRVYNIDYKGPQSIHTGKVDPSELVVSLSPGLCRLALAAVLYRALYFEVHVGVSERNVTDERFTRYRAATLDIQKYKARELYGAVSRMFPRQIK